MPPKESNRCQTVSQATASVKLLRAAEKILLAGLPISSQGMHNARPAEWSGGAQDGFTGCWRSRKMR